MSKHHHQDKAEQINNKIHDKVQSDQNKMSYQKNGPAKSADAHLSAVSDESSIQLRAYQIYNEKGGTALDNWLEAEQSLKNSPADDSGYVIESEPNTYKKINARGSKIDIYQ